MSLFSPALFSFTPTALWRWGRFLLVASLAFGLLVLTLMTWFAPHLLPVLPLLMLVGVAAWYLFHHPLLNLCVTLVGFVVVADYEAGFQFREIAYGLYLYTLLGHWYVTRCFLYRERILLTAEDKALFLFLILLPFTIPITILFGGSLTGVISESFSLSLLALYFPLKEACARYRYGTRALLLVILCLGVLVASRNVMNFQTMLSSATQAWQVATGRVWTNDNLLMVTSLFGLVTMFFARRWWSFGILGGCFLLCFAGLILTQSRGYWLAFLFGTLAMFVLVDAHQRKRMLVLGFFGLAAVTGIGFAFFGTYMNLLVGGLVERFASVQTAATADVSLINRFREMATVWDHVVRNPVIGYGMGVPYEFFDIANEVTDNDALVHNGYVGLWYKFGLWGLGLMLFFWARVIWRGVQAFSMKHGSYWTRVCGLAASLSLIAFTLSTITSNPFFLKDSLFIFSLVAGLAGGAYLRGQLERPLPEGRR
ncbi:MAG: O-antigen ligase family protein [Rhodothermales bacterium]